MKKNSLTQQMQSSSEECLKEKRHKFIGMCSLFNWFSIQNTKLMSQMQRSQPSQISKMEGFAKIANG